jgi:AcrR family transcriptional regulator
MDKKNTKQARRTQEERSQETQKKLLEATLDCLEKRGYAATSTTEIVKIAGTTRGALVHHYPNKSILVAEALVYSIRKRLEEVKKQIQSSDPEKLSLESRLRIEWDNYQKWFPTTIEFMVAARTDPDLLKAFSDAMNQYTEQLTNETRTFFPELNKGLNGLYLHYMIGCFIRGLCLEAIINPKEIVDKTFEEFVKTINLIAQQD